MPSDPSTDRYHYGERTVPTRLTWEVVAVFGLAAIGTFLAAIPAEIIGYRKRIMDHPGHRSSHAIAVPRTGGIAILLGMVLSLAVFGKPTAPFLLGLGSVAIIAAVSFIDDLITISSGVRLVVHLIVTTAAVELIGLELTEIHLPYLSLQLPRWVGLVVSVLFVAGFANFFNFMDGINGIAVSQGLFGGVTLAVLLALGGGSNSALVAVALTGASLGFLPHNFPKARMFMGDSGSTILGYILAMLTLVGAERTDFPWIAFVLPLGVFIYDATFTLFKRALRGENLLKPHREHHYQLLIRCGWTHTRVTGIQAGLMLVCASAGIIYAIINQDYLRLPVLAVPVTVGIVYSILVHRYFAKHRQDAPSG